MKFLFKITFLTLICMSNSILSESNPLSLEKIKLNMPNRKINPENQNQNNKQEEKAEKIAKCIAEIFNSSNCDCKYLNVLKNDELDTAKKVLVAQDYTTPKSKKRLQEEAEDFANLFFQDLSDKMGDDEAKKALSAMMEFEKITNDHMKCVQKILKTINELKKKNVE